MPLVRGYRVLETTQTTGTGTYSLGGAATGFQTFIAGIGGTPNFCTYCCEDGTDWEVGEGTVTAGSPDTLSRDTILASSNGGAAVNWGVGTRNIFCTTSAADPVLTTTVNTFTALQTFNAGIDVNGRIEYREADVDVQTLTDGANISWNGALGQMAQVTLGGNRNLNLITNLRAGASYVLYVIQDGTGGRTLTFSAGYQFPAGVAPILSSAANAVDILVFLSRNGSTLQGVIQRDFS